VGQGHGDSLPNMPTVAQVREAVERRYPTALAADWDAVGLVCGDPGAQVNTALLAVDPDPRVIDEAVAVGAQMLIVHHPLLLRPVHGVAATDEKGRTIHRLITSGIALLTAHTNADHADPGVSDALAAVLGLRDLRPLDPITPGSSQGTGRIGVLPEPMTLASFAGVVAAGLPATAHGVRVAGEADQQVRTVAVCGGAGDSLLGLTGQADAYVTADLRHHRAGEHRADGGCALIDVAHWASEWPWLRQLQEFLAADLPDLRTVVSTVPTDPWDSWVPSSSEEPS
jgi:dinuclear metal center YbgI/SA1388 family protein